MHSTVSAQAKRPNNANTKIRGQRPANAEVGD